MFCRNCGNKLELGDLFCRKCGTRSLLNQQYVVNDVQNQQFQPIPKKVNKTAVLVACLFGGGLVLFYIIYFVLVIILVAAGY